MAIEPIKYVRNPLYVDCVQVTDENIEELATWCHGGFIPEGDGSPKHIQVRVHNPKSIRQTQAMVGDWILYTERGYKVYTPKAFEANFTRVEVVKEKAE